MEAAIKQFDAVPCKLTYLRSSLAYVARWGPAQSAKSPAPRIVLFGDCVSTS